LGGAITHTSKSGVADLAFENDVEALLMLRRFVNFLPANNKELPPVWPTDDKADRKIPSLDTLIPADPNKPYDMKELIHKVVDDNDFFELQADYAGNILTGFGRMQGSTVGIVANQPLVLAGCLDIDSSKKAARFVRFCDAFQTRYSGAQQTYPTLQKSLDPEIAQFALAQSVCPCCAGYQFFSGHHPSGQLLVFHRAFE